MTNAFFWWTYSLYIGELLATCYTNWKKTFQRFHLVIHHTQRCSLLVARRKKYKVTFLIAGILNIKYRQYRVIIHAQWEKEYLLSAFISYCDSQNQISDTKNIFGSLIKIYISLSQSILLICTSIRSHDHDCICTRTCIM